jgi:hypothetical protein
VRHHRHPLADLCHASKVHTNEVTTKRKHVRAK